MDRNECAASRYFADEEAFYEAACLGAAELHGVADKALECNDGEFSCPECPWKNTADNWKPVSIKASPAKSTK